METAIITANLTVLAITTNSDSGAESTAISFVCVFPVIFFFGFLIYKAGKIPKTENNEIQKRLDRLPVVSTDSEIAAAISGSPKNYLVKNYVFKNVEPAKDNVFNAVEYGYPCISITKETYSGSIKNRR